MRNSWGPWARDENGADELIWVERGLLGADEERADRERRAPVTLPARPPRGGQQPRVGIAGGRRSAEIATDGARVADLGRPDGAGRLGQAREEVGEVDDDAGVGHAGAETDEWDAGRTSSPSTSSSSGELGDTGQIEQRRRPATGRS